MRFLFHVLHDTIAHTICSYGVSRVYAQQCGYVLADTQQAMTAIRALYKVVHANQLSSQAAKARYVKSGVALRTELILSMIDQTKSHSKMTQHSCQASASALSTAMSSISQSSVVQSVTCPTRSLCTPHRASRVQHHRLACSFQTAHLSISEVASCSLVVEA